MVNPRTSEMEAQAAGGEARSPGPSVQEILASDAVPPTGVLREESYEYLGSDDIPTARYTSPEWHRMEVEKLWRRCWQMACREEHVASPGDTYVYEIADASILIVRTSAHELKAYHNACLHRGATLRASPGNVAELRCPFHGFTWSLEGQLTSVPCEWDFPHVDPERFALPEVRVGTWAGWVFVNMDLDAEDLDRYMGGLPQKFPWPHEDFYLQAHVVKALRCNWKVALDAFIESFHVVATHPQLLAVLGDANTQYDVFPGQTRWNRMITAQAVQSPHIEGRLEEQEIMDSMIGQFLPSGAFFPVADGQRARSLLAMLVRGQIQGHVGSDVNPSDSELLDAIEYYLFPNFVPWGAYARINYRFRPLGNDPDSCLMDVMLLAPCAPGRRPAPAPAHELGFDDSWTEAPELGPLQDIFVQDAANLPRIQRGLKASAKPGLTLGNYQEVRIRHYHAELERWVSQA